MAVSDAFVLVDRRVVLAVNDGDNVRVYHTPLLRYFSVPQEAGLACRSFIVS